MKLLEKITLGQLELKNKMAMTAMTRSRANADGVVGNSTVLYYTQRASAGLIISEAINISEQAIGSPLTPGLYTQAQIDAWKNVTKSVHEAGGIIFAQLWHTGRIGHSIDKKGELPVAPSAIKIEGMKHFTSQGPKDYETPRALSASDIQNIIADYVQAAKNAIEAGFDGVELHGANGYLPNQFLAESANQRTDRYGGSIENNSRFILELMYALTEAIGGDKVGIKLSPFHPYGNILLENPTATFTYLLKELHKIDFAFVELMRRSPMFPLPTGYPTTDEIEIFGPFIKKTLIANTAYNRETGSALLQKGNADMIGYGSLFLANPDLPKRFELNAPLNQPDRTTMFGGGDKGYVDYPFLGN